MVNTCGYNFRSVDLTVGYNLTKSKVLVWHLIWSEGNWHDTDKVGEENFQRLQDSLKVELLVRQCFDFKLFDLYLITRVNLIRAVTSQNVKILVMLSGWGRIFLTVPTLCQFCLRLIWLKPAPLGPTGSDGPVPAHLTVRFGNNFPSAPAQN